MALTASKSATTTMAAGALVLRDDHLLMVHQRRLSGMRWELPSGGQEPGESLEEVAVREVAEETGIPVVAGVLICTYSVFRLREGSVVLGAIYSGEESNPASIPVPQTDDGIVEARFVDPHALPPRQIGHLTSLIVERWWSQRHRQLRPFHVEIWRTAKGYIDGRIL